MNWWRISGMSRGRQNSKFVGALARNLFSLRNSKTYGKWESHGRRIDMWFRGQSTQVVRACTRQFEFIAAQRIRRTIQIFHLYTKLWDELALKEFVKLWRRRLCRNARQILFSGIGVSMYNWDHEGISDEEMCSYCQEIDDIHKLRESTVTCAQCHLRLVIDTVQPGVKYCKCHGVKPSVASANRGEEWQPFIERQDMLVWRREEPDTKGLYAYKVYGTFADVSAKDFLQVQIDVEYRKEWDPTARELTIIDTDPKFEMSRDCRSDIIYWEMIWPRLFSNRDYVFHRRWFVDEEKRIIVIVSKGTEHPKAPNRADTYRVTTYWSYMVIRPYNDFDKPGIEFGLTYFDDPGINIPSAVTGWVAMSGFPDFLCRMRNATRDYQKYKSSLEGVPEDSVATNNDSKSLDSENTSGVTKSTQIYDDVKIEKEEAETREKLPNITEEGDKDEVEEPKDVKESSVCSAPEEQGFFYYFFFSRLFA